MPHDETATKKSGRLSYLTLPLSDQPDNFLAGVPNQAARDALFGWPDWPVAFGLMRGLCLYGPSGCGKTQLARYWAGRQAGSRWLSSDVAAAELDEFASGGDALVIDDAFGHIQRYGEQAIWQLVQRLAEQAGALLLIDRLPPARWPVVIPDLASRLRTVRTVAIGWPDDGLFTLLLTDRFERKGLRPTQEVIQYLAKRLERTPEAVDRYIESLDHASLSNNQPLGMKLVREAMAGRSEPS